MLKRSAPANSVVRFVRNDDDGKPLAHRPDPTPVVDLDGTDLEDVERELTELPSLLSAALDRFDGEEIARLQARGTVLAALRIAARRRIVSAQLDSLLREQLPSAEKEQAEAAAARERLEETLLSVRSQREELDRLGTLADETMRRLVERRSLLERELQSLAGEEAERRLAVMEGRQYEGPAASTTPLDAWLPV